MSASPIAITGGKIAQSEFANVKPSPPVTFTMASITITTSVIVRAIRLFCLRKFVMKISFCTVCVLLIFFNKKSHGRHRGFPKVIETKKKSTVALHFSWLEKWQYAECFPAYQHGPSWKDACFGKSPFHRFLYSRTCENGYWFALRLYQLVFIDEIIIYNEWQYVNVFRKKIKKVENALHNDKK